MKYSLVLLLATMAVRGAENPPNIVFILADDLGITDIGAYARHFTCNQGLKSVLCGNGMGQEENAAVDFDMDMTGLVEDPQTERRAKSR